MAVPIQALVFDAFGTLFDPYSVQSAAEKWFPGSGEALSRLWRAKQLEYTWLRSLMNRYEDFWQVTESALDFSCLTLQLGRNLSVRAELMHEYLRLNPYPDVAATLGELSGIPLLILSNGSPRMLDAVVDHAGLSKSFSALLSVDQVKTYKPSPAVYQLAVDKTGLEKGAIGFVSSNSWDVAGAGSFGFQTFCINRAGAIPDQLGVAPSAVLTSLSELPALCAAASNKIGTA
jgi:2-haloacid dehalogenase